MIYYEIFINPLLIILFYSKNIENINDLKMINNVNILFLKMFVFYKINMRSFELL